MVRFQHQRAQHLRRNSMFNRVVSATAGTSLLFAIYFTLGSIGLIYMSFAICLIATTEYCLLFQRFSPWMALCLVFTAMVLITHTFEPNWTLAALAFSFICLSSLSLMMFRGLDPQLVLDKVQWPLIGLIYTGLFPALSLRLLYINGFIIFLYLLITVFFGDIAAYFSGKYFGKKKIFPSISPQKTYAGSIGGLLGSVIFGGAYLGYFVSMPIIYMLLLSLVIGAFAQFGDFFESLIKRVSGKKDTSRLMPGHGGFLDRLDGVYFGSVVLFLFYSLGGDQYF